MATTPNELVASLQSEQSATAQSALNTIRASHDPDLLPLLLAHLEDDLPPRIFARTLEAAAPLCDATCVPALANALRSPHREIVKQACRAAQLIPSDELRTALISLLTTNPDDEIRFEAARALVNSTHADNFESLFAFVNFDKPDAASLHIVRAMPPQLIHKLRRPYARLAQHPVFSSSAIEAYRRANQTGLLFDEVLSQPVEDLTPQVRHMTLTALRRLTEAMTTQTDEAPTLSPNSANKLISLASHLDTPVDIHDLVQILAPFDGMLPTILTLSFTAMDVFSPDVVADVIERLPTTSAEALIDIVLLDDGLTSEPFGKKAILQFDRPNSATYAFFDQLTRHPTLDAVPMLVDATYAHDVQLVAHATQALAATEWTSQEAQTRLLELLGRKEIRDVAANALAQSQQTITLNQRTSQADLFDAQYGTRWAKAVAAQKHNNATPDDIADALNVLNEPRQRQAIPALAMLIATQTPPPELELEKRRALSHETQRLWLKAQCQANTVKAEELISAINDDGLAPQALECLIAQNSLVNDTIRDLLQTRVASTKPQIALKAMRLVKLLAEQGNDVDENMRQALQTQLYTDDERITHNALLALRAMHALPARETLATLYIRANDPRAKNRVIFPKR